MRFRFLHAADLHLDTPFTGLRGVDEQLAARMRDATLQAFENLVSAAQELEVSFVVLAGDIYDGAIRGVRAQLAFRDGLERLTAAGIRCFVAHGNHDPVVEGWSAIRAWPDGVTVFGHKEVESHSVASDGELLAVVHGISYPTRAVRENLALRFRRSPLSVLQVGVLHANVGGHAEHEAYSPCSVEDLEAVGLDYWALGHVHAREIVRDGDPWIAYPGNLQGLSPKESESGEKGALVVEVESQRVVEVSFLPLDVVRFQTERVDVAGLADVADVRAALVEAAGQCETRCDGRLVVMRAELVGRGEVHADLARPGVPADILASLRRTSAEETRSVWWESLEDETRPIVGVGARRGRGDFVGDLIATADAAAMDEAGRDGLLSGLLAELPVAELRRTLGDEVTSPPTEAEIERARDLALDLLAESEP